jgi:hypothetical protein
MTNEANSIGTGIVSQPVRLSRSPFSLTEIRARSADSQDSHVGSQTQPFFLALIASLSNPAVRPGQLRAQAATLDVVLRPGTVATVAGAWSVISDATAADGVAVRHPNGGAAKLTQALASPTNYFEVSFNAEGGIPYRL